MNYVLIADVNSDLTPELRKRFDIDYLKGHIAINGEDFYTDLDYQLFKDPDSFYECFNKKGNNLSTSPASVDETIEKFKQYLKDGKDIIYFALSSGLSGSYNFACLAKKKVEEEFPERKIAIIDTLRYATALGLLACKCGEMRLNGASFEEVHKFAEENKSKIHEMGPMDDLFYLAKAGRLSKSKAFMGTLVGVKPMGDFSAEGKTTVLTKEKGIKKALSTTIEYIKRTIVNPEEQIIFISETNRKENAARLKELVEKEIKPKEIIVVSCFPAGATNIGPGLAACYYFGESVSQDNEIERKIMNEIISNK